MLKKYSNESYRKQSQRRQNALIQRRTNDEGIYTIGETIGDWNKEIELKDNKTSFLLDKKGISKKIQKQKK